MGMWSAETDDEIEFAPVRIANALERIADALEVTPPRMNPFEGMARCPYCEAITPAVLCRHEANAGDG